MSKKDSISCARNVLNFSSIERSDRFDKKTFDPEKFIEKLEISSPKMIALLNKIEELDAQDNANHRKLFKHYIFSDLKKGYGAKILASGFVAAGYTPVIKAKGSNIVLDREALKTTDESKFAVLSSTSIWDATLTPKGTKEILEEFNKRPDNIYGDNIRFIILDSGFKEGVDLFDVKYVHIFEEQNTIADLTQAIGRGTRFCGQLGLKFNNGWDLQVFNYKLTADKGSFVKRIVDTVLLKKQKGILKTLQEKDEQLAKKNILEKNLLAAIQENSVDKYLNKNINNNSENFLSKYKKELMITTGGLAASLLLASTLKNKKRSEFLIKVPENSD